MNTYAITGGTGSLGTALTHSLLAQGHKVRTVSRNEHRISALEQSIPVDSRSRFSALVGDVRDRYRLHRAFDRVDYVIHAAALKGVGRCEYDPAEAMKTNVVGTQSVADACLDAGVKRAVFISSDKACSPVNLYGMTKATGERLWLASNRYSAGIGTEFVAVRYGNVWGSNGSVATKWMDSVGELSVTDPECTRFHLRLPAAVELVLSVLRDGVAGSLYVPILPSYRLRDLVAALEGVRKRAVRETGLTPGEKLHESMVNEYEAAHAVKEYRDRDEGEQADLVGRIRIDPSIVGDGVKEYTSGRNEWRLSVEELRKEIAWLRESR